MSLNQPLDAPNSTIKQLTLIKLRKAYSFLSFPFFIGKLIIPVFFILITSCVPPNTEENIQTEILNKKIKNLVDEATDLYDTGDYTQSNLALNEAESLLTQKTDSSLQILILINKSELLKSQGKYEECIKNYYEAANLSKLTKDTSRLGLSYYNISSTYLLMKNLENADKYNLLAQEIYRETSEESRLINCKIVHSSICRQLGEPEKAKEDLEEAIQFYIGQGEKGETTLSICLNNYANLLLSEEEHSKAISYYLRATEICKKLGNKPSLAIRYGNIGEAYLSKGEYSAAKKYIDSSLMIAYEIKGQETILSNLERLITYYRETKNPIKAYSTSDEYIKLKTELLQLESSGDILGVEKKYKQELKLLEASNKIVLLKKDNEVTKDGQRRTRYKLYFFILLTLVAIVIGYIIYKKQRKIRLIDLELYTKEREILAANNKLTETEKLQLEKVIEFKRAELTTFSINILEREKFLTELKSIFNKIEPNKIPTTKVIDELKQLFLIKNDDSTELFNKIESINSSFHFNLKSNHPELTDDDIRLASLVLLGLSTKEISKLLSIEPKSVSMKRYRLKVKLNLDFQVDLKQFLTEI